MEGFARADRMHKLAHLLEELGEIQAAIGKTMRWGTKSVDPTAPPALQVTNEDWMLAEIKDVEATGREVWGDPRHSDAHLLKGDYPVPLVWTNVLLRVANAAADLSREVVSVLQGGSGSEEMSAKSAYRVFREWSCSLKRKILHRGGEYGRLDSTDEVLVTVKRADGSVEQYKARKTENGRRMIFDEPINVRAGDVVEYPIESVFK